MAKRTTLQGKVTMQSLNVLQQRILRRLIAAGTEGMQRHDLYHSLGSPVTARSLTIALNVLLQQGYVRSAKVPTGYPGRPPEVYYATGKATE